MKKRFFAMLIATIMLISLFLVQTVAAEEPSAVAQIGDTKYETLAKAITAAEADQTITLLTDIVVSGTVVINKAITLDMNNKTISTAEDVYLRYLLNVSGNATIKNGTVSTHTEKETSGANVSPAAILITGDVALDTVTVKGYQCVEVGAYDSWQSPVEQGASLTLKNSTITTGNRGLITNTTGTVTIQDSTLSGLEPVYMNNGHIFMNSGEISATQFSVSTNNDSSFTLKDGTISGILVIYEGTFTMEGGSVTADNDYPAITVNPYNGGQSGAVYIKAGNVSNTGRGGIIDGKINDGYVIVISGGTFSSEIPDEYVAEDYICVANDNAENSYIVKRKPDVAQIGENKYTSLADAITAANDGDTITLLADIEVSETVVIDKDITLDLNGKTLSAEQLDVTSAATIENGSVVGTGYGIKVDTTGTVTINNTNVTGGSLIAIHIEEGTVEFNGGTLTTVEGDASVRLSRVSSDNKFIMNDGTINGWVDMWDGTFVMNGGTINAQSDADVDDTPCFYIDPRGTLIITGGTMNAETGAEDVILVNGTLDASVSGGTFNRKIPDEYVKVPYVCIDNFDGTYTVTKIDEILKAEADKAKDAIDAMTNLSDAQREEAKKAVDDALNTALDAINGENVTADSAALDAAKAIAKMEVEVSAADAVNHINGKTTADQAALIEQINTAKDAALTAISGASDSASVALAAQKMAAKMEVYKAAADKKAEIDALPYLTAERKAELKAEVDFEATKAIGNIDAADTSDGVTTAMNNGIEAINAVAAKAVSENDALAALVHTITFDANGGSVSPASAETGTDSKLASLPTPTRNGWYSFDGWYTAKNGGTRVTTSTVFTEDTTIYAHWDYTYIPTPTYYKLTFDVNGGTVISSVTRVSGTVIDLTDYITTREGYEFTGWYSDAALRNEITSVKLTKNTTVYAGWTEIKVNPFTDVLESDWYYEDVIYVYENGLMIGTDSVLGLFSPDITLNRATIVTTLWRLSGSPIVETDVVFTDLVDGEWYTDAMNWAIENEIILGYGDGTCGPLNVITHEQVCAIFRRYVKLLGYDTEASAGITTQAAHSEWAAEDVEWALTSGLFEGFESDISDLTKTANRAEIAAYLHRLCKLIED